MMTSRLWLPLLFLTVSLSTEAQLYKWTDKDGKINYSDTPPPQSITRVEKKDLASPSANNAVLPYELAQSIKNMPVTLYTGDKCFPCEEARSFLKNNGIPFSEKTVSTYEDILKFKQISGGEQLPVIFIGKNKLTGFNSMEWRNNLTQAGYPESNKLPANYLFPAPQALAPVVSAPAQPDKSANTKSVKSDNAESPTHEQNNFHF